MLAIESETYTTKARRLKAFGASIKGSIIDSMAKEAETILIPTKIKDNSDWLNSH